MGTSKEKMEIYDKVKTVPAEALKKITGGRLSGMSDINPMWRIKILTETFGVCGFGWKYEIVEQRLEKGGKDEIAAFVTIKLYVKINDVWSEPIPACGGSSFVALEKNGLYTSDECFKMALTDAIGVACKALGVAANVYFEKDRSKYDDAGEKTNQITTHQITVPERNPDLVLACSDVNAAKTELEVQKLWDGWIVFQENNTFKTTVNVKLEQLRKK